MKKEFRNTAHTDLALELKEEIDDKDLDAKGVTFEEHDEAESRIHVSTVTIRNRAGEKQIGKKIGKYITVEIPGIHEADDAFHDTISRTLVTCLRETKIWDCHNVLLAGIGNREITSDALGPRTVEQTFVNRHLNIINKKKEQYNISAIIPGVMAQTGMESSEIISGIIEQTKPDLVIVIDALASRSIHRVNRTIQITDTGIAPGSGLKNYRLVLDKESLGVPVLAIGVPTVVSARTIAYDILSEMFEEKDRGAILSMLEDKTGSAYEQMFVTSKNIDEEITCLSRILSHAIEECYGINANGSIS